MSEEPNAESPVESDYVAAEPKRGRSRRYWVSVGSAAVVVIAAVAIVAIAIGYSGSARRSNLMSLDSVPDTAPTTEASATTTEPPTTTVVDSSVADTSVDVPDTSPASDSTVPGRSMPKDLPLRATLRVTSATQLVAGEPSSYTLTVANPGEVDKPIRIISGWDDSDHAGTNAGVTVSGCAPPSISQNVKYFAFEAMLPARAVCTVKFDVRTNPNYFGPVKFSFTLADDYDHTESYWFAPAVTTIWPETTTSTTSTTSTVPVPETTPPSIA